MTSKAEERIRKAAAVALTAAGAALAAASTGRAAETPKAAEARPRHPVVEVAFVLDTTGSMSGLLDGAKRKVWSIANEIAKGRPTPKIRMGLVAYRDRGDAYVTRVFDLTANLDRVYADLKTLEAGGGGDGPEHVLKGLEDAIQRVSWTSGPGVFRVVYLVGDAPPHTDYGDTPKLERLLEAAVRKGLVVNAVQCGSDAATAEAWRTVARLGEGRYLAIAHDGGMAARATPFDSRIAALRSKLDSSMMGYGGKVAAVAAHKGLALSAAAGPAAEAADRAVYKGRAGFDEESDLAAAVEKGRVRLEDLKETELPDELRALPPAEREARLAAVSAERRRVEAELGALAARRERHLSREAAKARPDGFDGAMLDALRAQAGRAGIRY